MSIKITTLLSELENEELFKCYNNFDELFEKIEEKVNHLNKIG